MKSGKDVTPGHVSSFGVPKTLHVETTLNSRMFSYKFGRNYEEFKRGWSDLEDRKQIKHG